MEKRTLGSSDLKVAPLMLGGNVFGWTADQQKSFTILTHLVETGLNFVDTANVYSRWVPGNKGGESESIIGDWMKQTQSREKIVLATKCGMEMGPGETGLSKAAINKACDESLKRLKTDHIDLYMAHKDDETTPLEETLEAFTGLVKAGKVRYIGASNYTAARLEKALRTSEKGGFAKFVSLEPHYNLYDREEFEKDLEALCVREKLGVVPYWSLASGFLTGKYRSDQDLKKSPRGESVKKYVDSARGQKILKALDQVAEKNRTTPAAVALAWLMQRPAITAPIASATSTQQLDDLVRATELKLSAEDIGILDHTRA